MKKDCKYLCIFIFYSTFIPNYIHFYLTFNPTSMKTIDIFLLRCVRADVKSKVKK